MKNLIFVLCMTFSSSVSFAIMCNSGDAEYGRERIRETQSCTGSGYCNMYDYNSSTGQYEYYYGYHSNCPGERERYNEKLTCQRSSDKSLYDLMEYGFWSGCNIKSF